MNIIKIKFINETLDVIQFRLRVDYRGGKKLGYIDKDGSMLTVDKYLLFRIHQITSL